MSAQMPDCAIYRASRNPNVRRNISEFPLTLACSANKQCGILGADISISKGSNGITASLKFKPDGKPAPDCVKYCSASHEEQQQ